MLMKGYRIWQKMMTDVSILLPNQRNAVYPSVRGIGFLVVKIRTVGTKEYSSSEHMP